MSSSPVKNRPKLKLSSDTQALRNLPRQHIEAGAVTSGYKAVHENVLERLNNALASRIVCVFPYSRHQSMSDGVRTAPWQPGFLGTSNRRQGASIA